MLDRRDVMKVGMIHDLEPLAPIEEWNLDLRSDPPDDGFPSARLVMLLVNAKSDVCSLHTTNGAVTVHGPKSEGSAHKMRGRQAS